MSAPSRNTPCPCGSGKKFKHCCIDFWQDTPEGGFLPDPQCRIDEEVDAQYQQGFKLLKQGDLESLRELVNRMKDQYPGYPEPLELECEWAEAAEEWAIAAEACERLAVFKSPLVELSLESLQMYRERAETNRQKPVNRMDGKTLQGGGVR